MGESTETGPRRRLEALIGEWSMHAAPPDGPPWPGGGKLSFSWLEPDVPLVLQRWEVDMPEAPNGVAVIGCDGKSGGFHQLYTDDRDVQRVYAMALEDNVWTLERHGEPFSQRFTGRISDDGTRIEGRWEMSEDGETWRTDFELTYTRVG